MKNPIIFSKECRLFEPQRKTLQKLVESFPMDLVCSGTDFEGKVYPKLNFSSPYSKRKQLGGTYLSPSIKCETYTCLFNGDVNLKESEVTTEWDTKLKVFEYQIIQKGKPKGSLTYSQSWSRVQIHPRSVSYGINLLVPLRKLLGIDGKPIFF